MEVCYLNFREAFDSVNRGLLIGKLQKCGKVEGLVQWIAKFLHHSPMWRLRGGDLR